MAMQSMAPVHALSFFERKLGPFDQGDDIAKLAAALEYMPLAIVQAAVHISQKHHGVPYSDILKTSAKTKARRRVF